MSKNDWWPKVAPRNTLEQHPDDSGLPINWIIDITTKDLLNITHAAALEDWDQVYVSLRSASENLDRCALGLVDHVSKDAVEYAEDLVNG